MTEYEDRFGYISNATLRKHMGDTLEYVIELSIIAQQYPEPLRSSCYKTAIVYLGSITEAALHYCVLKMGLKFLEKVDWQYNVSVLHTISGSKKRPTVEVVAGKRHKNKPRLKKFIDFDDLNRFCRDEAKLYGQDIFDEVNTTRKLRNKIHLSKLTMSDRRFSKPQVNTIALTTSKILEIVEKKLN